MVRRFLQKKPMVCELCGKHFRSRFGLKCHLNTHNQQFKFRCSVCNKGFQQRSNLERHMQGHISKTFSCNECESKFSNNEKLYIHSFMHWKQKGTVTNNSGMKKSQQMLTANCKYQDQNTEQFISTSDTVLGELLLKQVSERQDTVPVSMVPNTEDDYNEGSLPAPQRFGLWETDRFFIEPSTIPPKQTVMASNLFTFHPTLPNIKQEREEEKQEFGMTVPVAIHLPKVDDNPDLYLPMSNYIYAGGKSQSDKNTLKSMVLHKDKPFSCDRPRCNKTFKSKFGLRCHLNSHDGLYKYTCDLCGKQYQQRSNLNEHIRIHHSVMLQS